MKVDINDKTKRYITRSGRDVVLWSDKGPEATPILGAVVIDGGHYSESWPSNGQHYRNSEENGAYDLLEFTVKEGVEYQTRSGRRAKVNYFEDGKAYGDIWIEVTKSWKFMIWHPNGFLGAARDHPMDIMP